MGSRRKVPPLCRDRRKGREDVAYVRVRGRKVYLGPWDSDEASARYREVLKQIEREPAEPYVPAGRVSVTELCRRFLEHARVHYRRPDGSLTREFGNLAWVASALRDQFGVLPAAEFGPRQLRALRDTFIEPPVAADDETPRIRRRSTVNSHARRTRQIFRWGVAHELVPPAVLEALRAVEPLRAGRSRAAEPVKRHPVLEAHVDATLAELGEQPEVAALVRLQRVTGARSTELLEMRAGDVDRSRKPWIYEPRHHKTAHSGAERQVALGPRAREILAPWLEGRGPADLVFPRSTPERWGAAGAVHTKDSYRQYVQRAARRAGVPVWAPHALRHGVATELEERYGIAAAAAVLGHANEDTTRIYVTRRRELLLRIAEESC